MYYSLYHEVVLTFFLDVCISTSFLSSIEFPFSISSCFSIWYYARRRSTAHQNIVDDPLLLVQARAALGKYLGLLVADRCMMLHSGTWDVPVGYLVEAFAMFVEEAIACQWRSLLIAQLLLDKVSSVDETNAHLFLFIVSAFS
jgi:hypothetical protein